MKPRITESRNSRELPPELWSRIFALVQRHKPTPGKYAPWSDLHQHDLTSLVRVSKLFHDLASPLLYREPVFQDMHLFFFPILPYHTENKINERHLTIESFPSKRKIQNLSLARALHFHHPDFLTAPIYNDFMTPDSTPLWTAMDEDETITAKCRLRSLASDMKYLCKLPNVLWPPGVIQRVTVGCWNSKEMYDRLAKWANRIMGIGSHPLSERSTDTFPLLPYCETSNYHFMMFLDKLQPNFHCNRLTTGPISMPNAASYLGLTDPSHPKTYTTHFCGLEAGMPPFVIGYNNVATFTGANYICVPDEYLRQMTAVGKEFGKLGDAFTQFIEDCEGDGYNLNGGGVVLPGPRSSTRSRNDPDGVKVYVSTSKAQAAFSNTTITFYGFTYDIFAKEFGETSKRRQAERAIKGNSRSWKGAIHLKLRDETPKCEACGYTVEPDDSDDRLARILNKSKIRRGN